MSHTSRSTSLPDIETLKTQARKLRADLSGLGKEMTQAQALETLAHQWGFKDWNTLSAKARQTTPVPWQVGQRTSGHYLGHAFDGKVKSVKQTGEMWALTIVFDNPVDVVTSKAFSAFRKQVSVRVDVNGRTFERVSDGTPHMQLTMA